MKEYIKKFESASDAGDYPIVDIPFTTSIATNPIQNLVCNQENKKIVVDGQGIASIVDATKQITIHYEWGSLNGRWKHEIVPERDIAEPLQQDKVVTAPYTLTTEDFVNYHTTCDGYSSSSFGYSLNNPDPPYQPSNIPCHYAITTYGSSFEYDNVIAAAYWGGDDYDVIYFSEAPNFDKKFQEFTINQDITIYINIQEGCIAKDTPITLSNGTTKMIQDITYDDELLVWDFDNAQYSSAKPLWIEHEMTTNKYVKCTFDDGSELKLVGHMVDGIYKSHRVFNYTDQRFDYPQDCIGKEVYTEHGITTLVSCELVYEEVKYYNIITNYHINMFANNILTSCRYNNIYDIKDMKFVKDDRNTVDFAEYNNAIPYEYYVGMRLSEQTIPVNNSIKYIKNLLAVKKHVD